MSISYTDHHFFKSSESLRYVSLNSGRTMSGNIELSTESLQLLASFAPDFLRHLYPEKSRKIRPQHIFLTGCVVIIDVSGFTKLAATAFDHGPSGLDKFRHTISNIFDSYINIIYSHGGDVMSFAGDALICLFRPAIMEASRSMHTECVIRAVSCAAHISMRCLDTVQAHAAVSYGEVCVGILGGHEDTWSYLMSGECIAELAECLKHTGVNETMVAPSVFTNFESALYKSFQLARHPDSGWLVTMPATRQSSDDTGALSIHEDTANIISFIPRPVFAAVASEALNTLSEVRVVTSLFLKLESYSARTHRDLLTLQPVYESMQTIITELGGFIRQFIVDDKGCVLIVLWGVPTASFPNNCSRAVSCAAALSAKAKTFQHECSIGISTGTAYCGAVGSKRRQDYVAMGKMVNLAARLMCYAIGRILMDGATFECLPHEISKSITRSEGMSLKGFDDVVDTYCYNDTAQPLHVIASDVPKDNSLYCTREVQGALDKVFVVSRTLHEAGNDDFAHGDTHFAIVHGSPGSGKTAIIQKFYRDLNRHGIKMVCIRMSHRHESQKYALFRKFISEIYGDIPFNGMALLQEAFPNDAIVSLIDNRLPFLMSVLHTDKKDNDSTSKVGNSRVAPAYMFKDDTLVTIFGYLALKFRCFTFIIDGAEHIHEASWQLLHIISDRRCQVLFFLALTSHDNMKQYGHIPSGNNSARSMSYSKVSRVLSSQSSAATDENLSITSAHIVRAGYNLELLKQHQSTIYIGLELLNYELVAQCLHDEFTHVFVPSSVIKHVYDLSAGNPFWVFILIRFIRECSMNIFERLVERNMAHNVLATCLLAKYTMQQQVIIKIATVFGDEFDINFLYKVLPRVLKTNLTRTLSIFVHDGLIYRLNYFRYRFQNGLLRNALYDLMAESEAQHAHHKVAKLLASEAFGPLKASSPSLSSIPEKHQHSAFKHAVAACYECFNRAQYTLGVCHGYLAVRVAQTKSDVAELKHLLRVAQTIIDGEEYPYESIVNHITILQDKVAVLASVKIKPVSTKSMRQKLFQCFRK